MSVTLGRIVGKVKSVVDMLTNFIVPVAEKSMAAKAAEAPATRRADAKDFIFIYN